MLVLPTIIDRRVFSSFSRTLRIAAHNLDLVGLDRSLILQLEVDILDEKGPDFIAEAVCVQMTLCFTKDQLSLLGFNWPAAVP